VNRLGPSGFLAVVLIAAGCAGSHPSTVDLIVRIASGPSGKEQRFTLRCDPTGGDIPNRASLCAMIANHPHAMLDPGQARSVCLGSPNVPPSVWVSGVWHGRRVRVNNRVMCNWPGGVGALAYWAAAYLPHDLALAVLRLHCDEDRSLRAVPIAWKRVRACLSAVPPNWHPSRR
jgi:hypothetical protein